MAKDVKTNGDALLAPYLNFLNYAVPTGEDEDGSGPLLHNVSSGSSTVFTLALAYNGTNFPNAAYSAGLIVTFRAHTGVTGAATMNINGIGAKAIRRLDGTALASGDFAADEFVVLIFDATADYFRWVSSPHGHTGAGDGNLLALGGRDTPTNFSIVAGGTPDEEIVITADELILQNAAGGVKRVTSISLTCDNTDDNIINGIWPGSVGANTWYYVWITSGSTGTCSGIHTSTTLATVLAAAPAGYGDFGLLVGAIRTDASSDFIAITQYGNHVTYNVNQEIQTGGFTPTSWTTLSVTGFFPPNARLTLHNVSSGGTEMALSHRADGHGGEYHGPSDTAAGAQTFGGVLASGYAVSWSARVKYASSIAYYFGSATTSWYAIGWEF